MRSVFRWWGVVCLLGAAGLACAQEVKPQLDSPYSRRHTFTVFAEYAPTSSHIVAGGSQQRKVADLGFGYSFRVVRFLGTSLSYHAEVRPVLFESDPVSITFSNGTYTGSIVGGTTSTTSGTTTNVGFKKCLPDAGTLTGSGPGYSYTIDYVTTCGRRWTFGQAFSPAGIKYNFWTRHALQLYAIGSLGYMYTSRPVPTPDASPFNYLIQVGGGVELYRSHKRSVAAECVLSHISNWGTANSNPGVDQVVYRVAYSFGR